MDDNERFTVEVFVNGAWNIVGSYLPCDMPDAVAHFKDEVKNDPFGVRLMSPGNYVTRRDIAARNHAR